MESSGTFKDTKSRKTIRIIGLAPWKIEHAEPRHHNFHFAISRKSLTEKEIKYWGLENEVWILEKLSRGETLKFPVPSIKSLKSFMEATREKSNINCFFLYEGSIAWVLYSHLIQSLTSSRNLFLINLFPPDRYSKISPWESLIIRPLVYFSRRKNIVVTVDSEPFKELLQDKGIRVETFFLPSSEPSITKSKESPLHSKVLLLNRGYSHDQILDLVRQGCELCTFTVPIYENQIENYRLHAPINLRLEISKPSIEDYTAWLDGFDYVIFLYKRSNNSSGRILDFLQRDIPVCIPDSHPFLNWASRYATHQCFQDQEMDSINAVFDHPDFVPADFHRKRDFSAENFGREIMDLFVDSIIDQDGGFTRRKFTLTKGITQIIIGFTYLIFAIVSNAGSIISNRFSKSSNKR